MSFNVGVNGVDEFMLRLTAAEKAAPKIIDAAAKQTAFAVMGRAIKRIQRADKTGRVYKKYNPNRLHRASAPGEAPATDTSELVKSIRTPVRKGKAWVVGSSLPQSRYLEFGTRTMRERPWLRPSLQEERRKFGDRIRKMLKAANT